MKTKFFTKTFIVGLLFIGLSLGSVNAQGGLIGSLTVTPNELSYQTPTGVSQTKAANVKLLGSVGSLLGSILGDEGLLAVLNNIIVVTPSYAMIGEDTDQFSPVNQFDGLFDNVFDVFTNLAADDANAENIDGIELGFTYHPDEIATIGAPHTAEVQIGLTIQLLKLDDIVPGLVPNPLNGVLQLLLDPIGTLLDLDLSLPLTITIPASTIQLTGYTDDVAPTVTANPAANHTGVTLPVFITYSEAIVIDEAFMTDFEAANPGAAIEVIDGNQLQITPAEETDGNYNITLPAGLVTDLAGNDADATDYTFAFSTEAPELTSDAPIAGLPIQADVPASIKLSASPLFAGNDVSLTATIINSDIPEGSLIVGSLDGLTAEQLINGTAAITVSYVPQAGDEEEYTATLHITGTLDGKTVVLDIPVTVGPNTSTGIGNAQTGKVPAGEEIYTLTGVLIDASQAIDNNLYIKKIVYTDGTSEIVKFVK